MAENTEKKILLDVQIKAADALKNLAQLKIQIDELKETHIGLKTAMKEVDTSTAEGAEQYEKIRQEYEQVGQEIKALTTRANEYQKTIQSNVKYEHEQTGSLQQLKAELSLNTAAYNKLSEAERNTVKGSMLQRQIVETTDKLKEAESELGNFRRSVGDYSIAGKALRDELRDLTKQMIVLAEQGQENSAEYVEAAKRAGELKDAIMDVNAEIKSQASDTATLDGLTQSVSAATAAYGTYKAATQALGVENETLEETMQKLMIVNTAIISLQEIQNALQKQSSAIMLVRNNITKAGTIVQSLNAKATAAQVAAENGGIIAKTKAIVITKLATAAQWLWNAAVSANPIMIFVIAIVAAIAAIAALISILNKSSVEEKAAAKAAKEYEEQRKKTAETIDNINRQQTKAYNERENQMRREILQMQANGAASVEIIKTKAKAEEDLRNIEINSSKARVKTLFEEHNKSLDVLKTQKDLLATMKTGSKRYKEQTENIRELTRAHNELVVKIREEQQAQINLTLQNAEALQKTAEERKKQYQDNAQKMLEMQKKFQDEANKVLELGMSKDFSVVQKWNVQKFNENQEYERKRLDMQRKFGQITATEYKLQNELLNKQAETFRNAQIADGQKYLAEQMRSLQNMMNNNADAQIDEINRKYEEAQKRLRTNEIPEPVRIAGESVEDFDKRQDEYKQYWLKRAEMELAFERQQAKEIADIRNSVLNSQLSEVNNIFSEKYAEDFAKFADNEREKTKVSIEMQKERSNASLAAIDEEFDKRRRAIEQSAQQLASLGVGGFDEETQKKLNELEIEHNRRKNLQIAADNAEMRTLESKKNLDEANSALAAENLSAKQKYDIKKEYLDRELEIYAGNKEKEQEIAMQQAELERELLDSRIAAYEEWSSRVGELLSAFNDAAKASEEAKIQQYEENNTRQKEVLENRLKSGLISQENYDKKVKELDKDLDRQKAELARKQAIRDKALKTFGVITATIQSIAESAKMGFPAAIPFVAMAGIFAAAQIAAIVSQPLPKARRGMLLKGKSHAQGGIPIEAEDGEVVINKRSVQMFKPLLSAINQAGGGVPFAGKYADGGYISRSVTNQLSFNKNEMVEAFSEAIAGQRIFLAMDEFRNSDGKYSDITDYSLKL